LWHCAFRVHFQYLTDRAYPFYIVTHLHLMVHGGLPMGPILLHPMSSLEADLL